MQKKKNLKLFYQAFFIMGIAIPIFDPLYPYFSKNFNIGFDRIGLVFFTGSVIAVISMIAAGRLSDRVSTRKMFLWSFIISLAGFAVFCIFHNFIGLVVTVIIINVGLMIFWPAVYSRVFLDYSGNYSNMLVRLERFYCLGTVIGPLLISLVLYLNLSPRLIFLFLLLVFIYVFAVFFYRFRDNVSGASGNYSEPGTIHAGKKGDIKYGRTGVIHSGKDAAGYEEISYGHEESTAGPGRENESMIKGKTGIRKKMLSFFTPTVILINISLVLLSAVNTGTSAWLTTYFTTFNIKVSFSAIFVSVYWFSAFLGLQVLSKVMHRYREENILFFIGLVSTGSLVCFAFISLIYVKILFLIILGMAVSGIFPLCGALTISQHPSSSGTASGFSIAMGLMGGMIVSPVMGFVAQYLSKSYVSYVLVILAFLGTIMSFILLRIIKAKTPIS